MTVHRFQMMVLNDGETFTDVEGCMVLEGTSRQIDLVLEEGRDYETEVIGQITIPILRITKVRPEDY